MVNGYTPTSLDEALRILATEQAVPYAGGTDLMLQNRKNASYLFLEAVPEIREIREDDRYIRIGAAVTFTEALESDLVPPLMRSAARNIASPAIRNAGTFGGNLGNGSAKADSVVAMYAADARICLASLRGVREVPVEAFYLGYRKVDLAADELITEILLPRTGLENWYYEKAAGRRALAISNAVIAGTFTERDGRIARLSAAVGAVWGNVLRFRDLEEMLIGKTPKEAAALKEDWLQRWESRMNLLPDRVSVEYRKHVSINLLREMLTTFGI